MKLLTESESSHWEQDGELSFSVRSEMLRRVKSPRDKELEL